MPDCLPVRRSGSIRRTCAASASAGLILKTLMRLRRKPSIRVRRTADKPLRRQVNRILWTWGGRGKGAQNRCISLYVSTKSSPFKGSTKHHLTHHISTMRTHTQSRSHAQTHTKANAHTLKHCENTPTCKCTHRHTHTPLYCVIQLHKEPCVRRGGNLIFRERRVRQGVCPALKGIGWLRSPSRRRHYLQ